MSKILGYIISIIGIVAIIFSKTILGLSFIKGTSINITYIIIGGIVLVVLGIALNMMMEGGSSSAAEEVPVYDKTGKKLVGYRKTK